MLRQNKTWRRANFLLFCAILLISLISNSSHAINAQEDKTEVLLFSKITDSELKTALEIDTENLNIVSIYNETTIEDLSLSELEAALLEADVIFINRLLPSDLRHLHLLKSYINGTKANKGMVCLGVLNGTSSSHTPSSPDFSPEQVTIINDLLPVNLSPQYISSTNDSTDPDYKIQTKVSKGINKNENVFTREIPWESAAAVSFRTIVKAKEGSTVILESIDGEYTLASEWTLESGAHVMFYSMEVLEENLPFRLWPYFNYLIYVTALHADNGVEDSEIHTYYGWGHAPVPKTKDIGIWFTVVGILWIASFLIYKKFKSLTHKDPLYQKLLPKYAKEAEELRGQRKIAKEEKKKLKMEEKIVHDLNQSNQSNPFNTSNGEGGN